jgi:mRNA-degrading endonuclease toxin of MazEF toxin-antitoxin module
MISVLKKGPPAVIVSMRSNARKQSSMVSTEMISRKGSSIGSVMCRKIRTLPAPSIRAASYRSCGMVCSAASQ